MPPSASGVTMKVTHGMASRLAASATAEACPNSTSPSGVSASVMRACSRKKRRARRHRPGASSAPEAKPPAGPSLANSMPTATKLSQKPGCSSAHGCSASTAAQAVSQVACQGQRKPASRSSATAASISTVRCAGTPQPLSSA